MANKKIPNRRERPRPDRYSDKTDGKLKQTLRLTPEQNKVIREASKLEGLSINNWAVRILVRFAERRVAIVPPLSQQPRKRVKKIG